MELSSDAGLEDLFDHYFAHGCPCRFPRFRATVARDLKEIGADEWTSADTVSLLRVFDRRMELQVATQDAFATTGTCKRCGARVRRYGIPVYKDSFIERARIEPGSMPDVGAAVHGVLPICGSLYPAGPISISPGERREIENSFPHLTFPEWLEYMRALSDD